MIGANDAGKSSTLDLLEMALGARKPDDNDFFCREEEIEKDGVITRRKVQADSIEVTIEFKLSDKDAHIRGFAIGDVFRIRKIWRAMTSEMFYWGKEIVNPELAQDFSKLKKAELETIIQSIDPSALPILKTNENRIAWLEQKAKEAPTKECWISTPSRWGDFIPRFERYNADFDTPFMFHPILERGARASTE